MALASWNNTSSMTNVTTSEPATLSPSLYSYNVRIGVACIWALTGVLGLVGNSLVIWSVVLSKKLRSVTNAFVVNLGVADFWTSLSYPWMAVALLSNGSWPLATEVPCYIAAVQFHTGLGASLYSLAAIAFNRFMLVTEKNETYSHWYSPFKVSAMIAATWIIPFIVFFLPPVLGVGDFGYDPQDNTCSDKDGHPRGAEYNLAQVVGLFPVPVFIIVCSYTALYVHLKRHFREQKRRTQQQSPVRVDRTVAKSTVWAKNLFIVFCVFFLLVSPYFISLVGANTRSIALYLLTITIQNSCVNPIIYTVNHLHFKGVLRKILCCRYSQIPEPSDLLKVMLSRKK